MMMNRKKIRYALVAFTSILLICVSLLFNKKSEQAVKENDKTTESSFYYYSSDENGNINDDIKLEVIKENAN